MNKENKGLMTSAQERDLLSKTRQNLRRDAQRFAEEAFKLETRPYLLETERAENLSTAKALRGKAQESLALLSNLRTGTPRQKLAGFGH